MDCRCDSLKRCEVSPSVLRFQVNCYASSLSSVVTIPNWGTRSDNNAGCPRRALLCSITYIIRPPPWPYFHPCLSISTMFPYAHLETPLGDALGFSETTPAFLEDMASIDSIDPFSLHYKLDPIDASPLALFGPYESSSSSNSTRSTATPDNDYCSDQETHPEDADTPFWRRREDTPYPNRSGTPFLRKREDTPAEDES